MRSYRAAFWAACFVVTTLVAAVACAEEAQPPASVVPAPRMDQWWQDRHAALCPPEVLFIGDSITHGWEAKGKEVWRKYYGPRKARNLGFSGDQTQHVLWRLEHGSLEGISPKLAVLMIGTNNAAGKHKPEETAEGVKAIVEKLRTTCPQMKILVLAIFPRDAKPDGALRQINNEANALIAKLADDKSVFYLDLGPQFLAEDGTLSPEIMPDYLHPNEQGYAIWAEAMEPTLAKLLE